MMGGAIVVDVVCLRPEEDFLSVGVIPPAELSIAYRAPSDKDVRSLLQSARALVLPSAGPHLEDSLFDLATELKLIQFTGAGWDRIAETTLRRCGCFVANIPGVNAIDVAEYVVIAAGTLLRKLKLADELMWNGRYGEARQALAAEKVRGFRGLTVGVVGLGHIGLTVAKLFRLLGAKVGYYDPQPRYAEEAAEAGIAAMFLHDLLAASDVITMHVPLIPATRGLIGPVELDRLKPGAIVIQASRGGVVEEESLLRRLKDGALGGVALDVFHTEPLPMDAPLLTTAQSLQGRLLLTPHIAGVTQQAAANLYTEAWANVERILLHQTEPLHQLL